MTTTLAHKILPVTLIAAVVSCGGGTVGARPDDMSAAHHAAAAEGQEAQAEHHQGLYDATAQEARERCASGPVAGAPCWSWMSNPTEHHLEEAAQHRQMAADHRAASEALRNAEAASCHGIDPMDRDMCPLMSGGDVVSVTPLYTTMSTGRGTQQLSAGATIQMRAVPGLTAEWLQTVLGCHIARAAVLGHDEAMPNCPLAPAGAQVQVRSAGDGFAIELRGPDATTAEEILRRAQTLTSTTAK